MSENQTIIEIYIDDDVFPRLLGIGDSNLRYLESRLKTKLTARGNKILIKAPLEKREQVIRVFQDLEALYISQRDVTLSDIDTILRLAGVERADDSSHKTSLSLELPRGTIFPKNKQQERYMRAIEDNPIVFSIGPAGTGKTYLAVAMAVDRFNRRTVDKIILVRPVVESGENLGFLPGDILEKVDPYFKPLYDALDEMLGRDRVRRFIERGMIEIAPLAYMRGRTLNNAFVILDEAQNTTSGQMKMFLTRLGVSSQTVLTGDLTQVDLPPSTKSGLLEAKEILQGIKGIAFIEFDSKDVIRHKLVAEILNAYENKNGEL